MGQREGASKVRLRFPTRATPPSSKLLSMTAQVPDLVGLLLADIAQRWAVHFG